MSYVFSVTSLIPLTFSLVHGGWMDFIVAQHKKIPMYMVSLRLRFAIFTLFMSTAVGFLTFYA
jgi:hypothetical protein